MKPVYSRQQLTLQRKKLMGMQSIIYPPRHAFGLLRAMLRLALLLGLIAVAPLVFGQTISAVTTPLQLPTSIAFDAQGNLYIAETNNHIVRRVDVTGVLTTVAGNGTQGFAGDGGAATAAMLDSPAGVVVDSASNLYIADAHNHRVRRVDGVTGVISTVAGSGRAGFSGDGAAASVASLNLPSALAVDAQGNVYIADTNNYRIRKVTVATGLIATVAGDGVQRFAGDGGLATAASVDSPSGLAVDGAGILYIADSHNHRVRAVTPTGLIFTVAGTGVPAFAGDGGVAGSAALALPRGVSVDGAGNVYVADANNQRIRRIAVSGTITTIAGNGVQAFSGDGGLAAGAALDTPSSTALSPMGLATLADTGNERVRQVSASNEITTIAGLGTALPETLTMAAPATIVYGTGSLTATLTSSPAAGSVTFYDTADAGTKTLGTVELANNSATLSTAALAAGTHHVFAIYSGDAIHTSVQSAVSVVSIAPVPLTASVTSASMVYGQTVPAFSGALAGVLAQDAGNVTLTLSTTATVLSPVGMYPIIAALGGSAAGNYVLAPLAGAALTISKAASLTVLSASSLSVTVGMPVSVTLHVASATTGTPTGSVMLLDGGVPLATLPLSTTGSAGFVSSALSVGDHALTAVYAGDGNFVGSRAMAQTVSITPVVAGDFTLAATSAASQTISAGGAASFNFAVQMQGVALNSPITLATSVLPVGMTATFSPAYLPPGGAVTSFALTVQTPKSAVAKAHVRWIGESLESLAVFLLPLRMRRRLWSGALVLLGLVMMVGCGDRVVSDAAATANTASYPITVMGTATGAAGKVLQHTATITLTVQ